MRSSFCFALAASLCRWPARAGSAMLRRGGAEKAGDAGAVGGLPGGEGPCFLGFGSRLPGGPAVPGQGRRGRALPTVPHAAGECENSLSKAVFLAADLLFAP